MATRATDRATDRTSTGTNDEATTPLHALVGAADLALENARQAPGAVLARTLGVTAAVEKRYTALAARGRSLVRRLSERPATRDLVGQARATVRLTRAAATTARRTAEDVAASSRETLRVGRQEPAAVAGDTAVDVEEATRATRTAATRTAATRATRTAATRTAGTRTAATRTAATRTAGTARKRAADAQAAAKGD